MKHTSTSLYLIYLLLSGTGWLAAQAPAVKLGAGADLYHQYCAVCHGSDGKGDGPVASTLRKRPANLTQIARQNGGKFPELHVMSFIKGEDTVIAHGSREMPMWGPMFSDLSGNRPELVQMRIYALLKYLEAVQAR